MQSYSFIISKGDENGDTSFEAPKTMRPFLTSILTKTIQLICIKNEFNLLLKQTLHKACLILQNQILIYSRNASEYLNIKKNSRDKNRNFRFNNATILNNSRHMFYNDYVMTHTDWLIESLIAGCIN